MTYDQREKFEHAPIALVTAQLSFGYEPRLNADSALDRFGERIRPLLPALNREPQVMLVIAGLGSATEQTSIPQIRATAQDGGAIAVLNASSLVLSMSGDAYDTFDDSFAPLFLACVDALDLTGPTIPATRLGLRFIDEIRPPVDDVPDLGRWVRRDLIALTGALPGATVQNFTSAAVLRRDEARTVRVTVGTFDGSTVVGPDIPFARLDRTPQQMVVLDVDSAWEPGQMTYVDADDVAARLAGLHDPCAEVFQWAITDDARMLFRGSDA